MIISEIDSGKELMKFGDAYRLMIQHKLSRGNEMIDMRMWVRWNTDHEFHPGSNGLMMELDKFKEILPKIQEYIDSVTSHNCDKV